jgi:signal transduction histidine kinase
VTVQLHSRDERVFELCRRTLQSLDENDFGLRSERPDQVHVPVDLTIWDIDATFDPRDLQKDGVAHQTILIVARERLDWLRESLPNHVTAVLLKPVAEGPLRVCLEQALNRVKSTKNDSRALLQFSLEAIVKLQEYDQDRTNFLARAVHDFRAPLTALRGYCGLLLDQQLGPVETSQAEVLLRMNHSIERLSRMTEDMFQLSVGNRSDFKVSLRNLDLAACIDQAVHEIKPLVDEKEINLTVDMQASPDSARVDRGQIEQVLINILDNACKFTPRDGSIKVRGYPFFWERRRMTIPGPDAIERRFAKFCTPNVYRIDIQDSGPAIPRGQLSTVFEEYARCGGGQDRSGAGLGLAICKLIISRHHGRIWAEADADGNVFSLVLPFAGSDSDSLKLAC